MAYHYPDYPTRARRLADAGESLLEAMEDGAMDRGIVIVELEAAASNVAAKDLRLRFESAERSPEVSGASEDTLSGLLLEFQSANSLMSAGLALNEHGGGGDSRLLREAVAQVRAAGADLDTQIAKSAKLQFEPQSAPSASVDSALTLFQDSAGRTLESIAGGTEGIVNAALERMKDLDITTISQGIDNLGKSFEVVATAGKLIRQGLQKLKEVLDALSSIFGVEAIAQLKSKVREIRDKFVSGEYTKGLVHRVIGVPEAQNRVRQFAKQSGFEIAFLDGVSRELALLDDHYQGKRKILNGLAAAVVLGMGIVAALQAFGLWAAVPWIALAGAGAYAAVIGSALLVGMNYTGSRPLFGWIRGVCEIIRDPRPKAAQE